MADAESDFDDLMLAEEPEFQYVMECVFGIQNHESRAYIELLDAPGSTVAELADDLDRDRSNVNRSLSTLMEKGLIDRQRRLLDSGGYVYQYTAVSLPEAKERMHEALKEWSAQVHKRIDGFATSE